MYLIKLLANLLKILRGTRKTITYFTYQITRTEQKWPSNWLESLHVDQFKEALVEFLRTFWESDELPFIIGSKTIFVNLGDTCFLFCNEDGLMVRKIEEEHRWSHEEADSRMLCYLSKCSTSSNIVFRTIDSYVLITALDSLHFLVERKKNWMEFEWQQRGSNHNHLVCKWTLNHWGQKKI